MVKTLENDNVKVKINSFGAELQSLFNKKSGIEHMWNADPAIWKRHSPVLFPIVGKVVNNCYKVNDQTFELGQHGFARDMEFTLLTESDTSLTYELQWTSSTLEKYPYKFKLQIAYTLIENQLTVDYQVLNADDKPIFFSIGAHPGFTCPFFKEENYTDYILEFNVSENTNRTLLTPEGFRSGEIEKTYLNNQQNIPLTNNLFDDDAIIFEDLNSNQLTLKSPKNDHSLQFGWDNFKYLGIWAKPNAPFVCLEPWNGIADKNDFKGDFTEKKGVQQLNVSTRFKCAFFIKCF